MTIPVGSTSTLTRTASPAPSIGVDRAELLDTHGSLRFPAPKGSFLFVNAAFCRLLLLALLDLQQLHARLWHAAQGPTVRPRECEPAPSGRAAPSLAASSWARRWSPSTSSTRRAHFTATGLLFDWSFNIDFFAIVLGLIILAIAEVFAAGTRLDEDQALTI